jgi:hypothetical protein
MDPIVQYLTTVQWGATLSLVECTKYLKPVVRLSLNPTGYGLFQ